MFLKEETDDDIFTEHFSVPSPPPRSSREAVVGNRAIVVHEGREDINSDEWRCSRDRGADSDCAHIVRAKRHLMMLNSDCPTATEYTLDQLEEPETQVKTASGKS